ncbi:hypothetical protein MRB53_015536 [Persea americana]|uniref:Uncharacterized protein n=1 Tax=Persea americana TaxID=3435 RepID=A0ACC2LZJ8_PERAE|nr:hypothetical protein MRB53_015536 [Persea americana]
MLASKPGRNRRRLGRSPISGGRGLIRMHLCQHGRLRRGRIPERELQDIALLRQRPLRLSQLEASLCSQPPLSSQPPSSVPVISALCFWKATAASGFSHLFIMTDDYINASPENSVESIEVEIALFRELNQQLFV